MSTVFTLKSALGFTKTKMFFFFWRLASLLDRGNESDRKNLAEDTSMPEMSLCHS